MRAHRDAARRFACQSAPPRRIFDSARVPLYLNKLNRAAESRAGASVAELAAKVHGAPTAATSPAGAPAAAPAAAPRRRSVMAPEEIAISDVVWWHSMVKLPDQDLGCARDQLLCLLGARLAALGGSALPGRRRPTHRAPSHCLG